VLGAGRHQKALIARAEARGLRVVASDYYADAPGKALATYPVQLDATAIAENVTLARKYSVRGVITSGSDLALVAMAEVAAALGLPCYLTPEAARTATNKTLMARAFAAHGVPHAPWREVRAAAAAPPFPLPLVVKPADFLVHYRDAELCLPQHCFDLWEERQGIFTFTCATVWAALDAAAGLANLFNDQERRATYTQVTELTARRPRPVPVYEMWMYTGAEWRSQLEFRDEDSELLIFFSIVLQCGKVLTGAPPSQLFGKPPREWVLRAMEEVLEFHLEKQLDPWWDPRGRNSVLNACRTLRYAATGTFASKSVGGEWVLSRAHWPVVLKALQNQQVNREEARTFVEHVVAQLRENRTGSIAS
jgi:hypothetical protein